MLVVLSSHAQGEPLHGYAQGEPLHGYAQGERKASPLHWSSRRANVLHFGLEPLDADALAEIAEALCWSPLISPADQERAQGGRDLSGADRGGVERVHARIGPIATNVDVIEIFGAPDDANIAHERTSATIGTARHTHTQLLAS